MHHSKERNWPILLAILSAYIILNFLSTYSLINDELYFSSLSNKMNEEQIQHLIETNDKWAWLVYLFIPAYLLLKFTTVALIISAGYYIITRNWNFHLFFRAVLFAEIIYVMPSIIKIVYFNSIHANYKLSDLANFYPLSLASMVSIGPEDSWLKYPLQLASLFELFYWITLILSIRNLLGISTGFAGKLVMASYGSALFLWTILIMFVSISTI